MKLRRLRIEQLRQFRQPLEIDGFEPGLNLFTGANEAGKSSIVRAIRAAFFERHRSTMVEDLRPWGDSAAAPTVELEFDFADTTYRLSKTFLHRKRCELRAGSLRLEGIEAEDHLAQLLGFQFAGKGASKAEHWGIPGLLWIEQGSAHEVHEPVRFATDHLRTALQATLGEVASSGGDDILERVRAERALLLTAGSRPRGEYQKVIEDLQNASGRLAELDDQVEAYRQQVDTLAGLREQQRRDEAERPWEGYRAAQSQAEQALQAAAELQQQLARDRERLREQQGRLELLREQLAAFEQQQAELASREKAQALAEQRHAVAEAREQQLKLEAEALARRYERAREALRLARQEDSRQALQRQLREAQARAADLAEAVAKAEAEHQRLVALRSEAATTQIAVRELELLRKQHGRLHDLELRRAAAATRVRYALEPGQAMQVDGEALSGQGERLLVAPAEWWVPGVGRLRIEPGGQDLGELARQHGEVRDEHAALLQRLGLASLQAAEARHQLHRQQLTDIGHADQTLHLLAPKGLDALRTERAAQAARMGEAQAALDRLPPPPPDSVPALAAAEDEHEQARRATEQSNSQLHSALQTLLVASSERDAARRECETLRAGLADPQRRQRLQQHGQSLVESRAEATALAARIEAREHQVQAARPDILRQDIERLRRSAEQAEKQYRERRDEIIRLESALQSAGAQGLEETRGEQAREVEALQRRHGELQRRAEALDFLLTRLEAHRGALTRRLQAPLQRHLDRYLQLLFPRASLLIDEQLSPGPLTRPGLRGPETGEFASLSFGAREQMGVISRLAYADLLQEAGRATLVILDDALVHSDEQRLGQMKRVLFDAAQRHQILLFTCHPAGWRDLGVAPRAIEALKAG